MQKPVIFLAIGFVSGINIQSNIKALIIQNWYSADLKY